MYAEPVEWFSPTGEKLIGNVMINAKLNIGTIWGKANTKKPLKL